MATYSDKQKRMARSMSAWRTSLPLWAGDEFRVTWGSVELLTPALAG
jgi:hypothetical protein